MSSRLLTIIGILIAIGCFGLAASLHPGGFDWNRDYLSTLLRDRSNSARIPAAIGMLFYCVTMALVFERLSRADEFSGLSKAIRIGGIGSNVYALFAITPMHDMVVTISLAFFLVAVLPLTWVLCVRREKKFFVAGIVCLAVLLASATIYYTGHGISVLPWAQRASFVLYTIWLVSLDDFFPRSRWQDRGKF